MFTCIEYFFPSSSKLEHDAHIMYLSPYMHHMRVSYNLCTRIYVCNERGDNPNVYLRKPWFGNMMCVKSAIYYRRNSDATVKWETIVLGNSVRWHNVGDEISCMLVPYTCPTDPCHSTSNKLE